jgi:hypothetical protein
MRGRVLSESGGVLDRDGEAPAPGQQRRQIGDIVIGDPAEHAGEPCLRVDIVELGEERSTPRNSQLFPRRACGRHQSAPPAKGRARCYKLALKRPATLPAGRPRSANTRR